MLCLVKTVQVSFEADFLEPIKSRLPSVLLLIHRLLLQRRIACEHVLCVMAQLSCGSACIHCHIAMIGLDVVAMLTPFPVQGGSLLQARQ
jgi:hypothetical protein